MLWVSSAINLAFLEGRIRLDREIHLCHKVKVISQSSPTRLVANRGGRWFRPDRLNFLLNTNHLAGLAMFKDAPTMGSVITPRAASTLSSSG